MKRKYIIESFLFLMLLPLPAQVRDILVLNSYHQGYHWTDREMDGIKSVLDPLENVELHINYMDAKRRDSPLYEELLYQTYEEKYKSTAFEAILVTDDYGLDFLLEYGDSLFPDVPVIFCGLNFFKLSRLESRSHYAGIYEDYHVVSTINLMLEFHPQSQHVALISDSTLSGMILQGLVKEAAPEFQDRLDFEYLSGLSSSELVERLHKLDHDTLILYGMFLRDSLGSIYTLEEGYSLIMENSTLPVYTLWDTVGFGCIGGYVSDPFRQGQGAAENLLRLLQGESIQDLGVHGGSLVYKFDYKQLGYWGISRFMLPKNSLVLNLPFSVIGENKPFFLTLFSLIFVLILIIIYLFWESDRNKKMEKELLFHQELLSQNRKLDAVGQLAGGVAHDFNNLLTGILGSAELIQRENPEGEINEWVSMIIDSSLQAAELTSQLLAFGRKDTRKRTTLNIHDTIDDTLIILRKTMERNILIHVKEGTLCPQVIGIKSNIQNILMNLCLNASQAMEEGGSITISTGDFVKERHKDHARLARMNPGEYLTLTVRDTGPGIPREILEKIFEPYFTTREKGSGLGLATVYGTVCDHGGYIYAESTPEEGSEFHIFFPRGAY